MQRIPATDESVRTRPHAQAWPLFSTQSTRLIEKQLAATLAPHTLMARAGDAIARLAMALAPHAQTIWIACGPGNNGGDGFEAAAILAQRLPHTRIVVSHVRERDALPADAQTSWDKAQQAGVQWIADMPDNLSKRDLCIDALLGIGLKNSAQAKQDEQLLHLLEQTYQCPCQVLCVDVASGLDADTGQLSPPLTTRLAAALDASSQTPALARHTLALLTLQPGLFTGLGRDACGQIWWDDLGANIFNAYAAGEATTPHPTAHLSAPSHASQNQRSHNSHKGSFGDVVVLGGEGLAQRGISMTGAAWLAAIAALHGGAGRIMLALLDAQIHNSQGVAPWPEIMLRKPSEQDWSKATVVCGCGGGLAIESWLPIVLKQAPRLVLDADALNAVARSTHLTELLSARAGLRLGTVLTPHPLEAARLLETSTANVQANRLQTAEQLAKRFQCTVILKGSGSVIAHYEATVPEQSSTWINPTGNARLATGGTGDVLAGLIGALWAQGYSAEQATVQAVYRHGAAADHWPSQLPFSASALATRLGQ